MPSPRIAGHSLRADGAPFAQHEQRRIHPYEGKAGCGLCSCGTKSPILPNNSARKRWHRDIHKAEIRQRRLLLCGDWHGNTDHAQDMIGRAGREGCTRIMQLGDFGYWEHAQRGVTYLDAVDTAAGAAGVTVYFLDGNHDKTSLLLDRYTGRDGQGFIIVRPNIRYAPRGHRWTWGAVRFIALGGAYSIDKSWRLAREQQAGEPETLWFPEEEMTDADLDAILADGSPVDVILAHDKPRAATPRWNRKDIPECWPNADRIQRAARTLQPALIAHGHLHVRYTDHILVGDDVWCQVEGLDADPHSAFGEPVWDSWMMLPLDAAPPRPEVAGHA